MSYSRFVTIMDGIEIPRISYDDWILLLDNYVTNHRDGAVVSAVVESEYIERADVTGEDLHTYLSEHTYLIDCESFDNMYLGSPLITLDDNRNCSARLLGEVITTFPDISSEIFCLIQNLFPYSHINRYLIDWVI